MNASSSQSAAAPDETDASDAPRLAPIDNPSSWKVRLTYALARWQQDTVITPLKVAWARLPEGLRLAYEMTALEDHLTLDPEVHLLVKELVATVNGCAFCQDIAVAEAPTEDLPRERLDALPEYETHPAFTAPERAALTYAEEATRHVDVTDATFDALRAHFPEREIVEITWLVAQENFYNRMNRPLGIGSDGLCEFDVGDPA